MYINPGHAEFVNTKIINGITSKSGMIYISGFTSNVLLNFCNFDNNQAKEESSILFGISNSKGQISILNSEISNSYSQRNLIGLTDSKMFIFNTRMTSNFANKLTNGFDL